MKKLYLICFSIVSLGCLNAQTKYAKIVVYRNENTKEKLDEEYKIYSNENLTTSLKNHHFEEFYMPEGSFNLKANELDQSETKVECESGHTYYYRVNRNFSLPDIPIVIVAVDSTTATNELKNLKSYFANKRNVTNVSRRNGIGILLEPGIGFEKIGLFGTTVGTEVMHSFGGGASVGLSYSYKFSDYFGWSADISEQFSILSPSVTNASVTFNQGVLSTTPYFTIPLIEKNKQLIKIGGGVDYHFGCVLNIETSKLENGFNDNWTYNNAFGYHLITFYEGMITPNLRGHAGFKYNDVQYSFVSGETYQPLDPKLRTPRGNALSVSLGFEYCF